MRRKLSDLEVCEKNPEKCVEKLRIGKVDLLLGEMRRKICVVVFSSKMTKNVHTFFVRILLPKNKKRTYVLKTKVSWVTKNEKLQISL